MAVTSIDLDTALVEEAKLATGQTTTKGAVTSALQAVVRLARQARAVEAIARVDSLSQLLVPDVIAGARR